MKFRILSLDGGGMWGIVSATMLASLERAIGKPIQEYFDLVAGTSTGAILASGISNGNSPQELINLYAENGLTIFPYTKIFTRKRIPVALRYGILGPKHSPDGLKKVLQGQFGNKKISDIIHPKLLITAYDTLSRSPIFFKNWRSRFIDMPLWEACVCSSAAPTFFPAHYLTRKEGGIVARATSNSICFAEILNVDPYNKMQVEIIAGRGVGQKREVSNFLQTRQEQIAVISPPWSVIPDSTSAYSLTVEYSLIDGGVGANNPAACAIAEALRLGHALEDIYVLSVGTGLFTESIPWEKAERWGILNWATTISNVLIDASSDINDYVAEQVTDKDNYLRLQFRLDRDTSVTITNKIDDATDENLNNLVRVANDYINQPQVIHRIENFLAKAADH
jgi:patatin-like phospholipase/acyl hydrolase